MSTKLGLQITYDFWMSFGNSELDLIEKSILRKDLKLIKW